MHSLEIELLRRIQKSQIAAASRKREVTQAGPFRVMLNPASDLIWLNYAVPTADDFSTESIETMKKAFKPLGRIPRLEFLEPLWPALPAALETNGLELQSRLPMMVCTKAGFTPVDLERFDVKILGQEDDVHSYLSIGSMAFGEDGEVTQDQVERQRESIRAGPHRCALGYYGGDPAAVACFMPEGTVGELAGVATLSQFRRKGLALAVSTILLDELFEGPGGDEAIAWLAAGDDAAKAVYERLGFKTIATQANYILKRDR